MRLIALRLAGFKSFVEPTEIRFPSELVGIVGPNGCGKSNTLDAVRWVMGESSAKHLRGQSLDDVIFAGSGQRKQVAQASVELVFDNSAGLLQGQWARFQEISIRRLLTRDGQSRYFLNGTRCRRKDIADLFLGTGLGSRSYAIIEQGQINRLIEARPEEMRATLEEAAGISRYKERRRETESSIQHTRENLARLDDLRDELGRQLDRLERQARTAERFRQLQAEEGRLALALHALQLRRLEEELGSEAARLAEEEAGLLAAQAALQQGAARLEAARAREAASQETLHQAQAAAYAQGAEVARLEQALRHARELRERVGQELQALEQEAALHERMEGEAGEQLARLTLERDLAREGIAALEAAASAAREGLQTAEAEALRARQAFEAVQVRAQEPAQQVRVERTRLEHAERQQRALHERRQRLRLSQLEDEARRLEDELAQARAASDAQAVGAEALEQAQAELDASLREARSTLAAAESAAEALRHEEAGVAAELRALRALEQALIGGEPPALRDWLRKHGLGDERAGKRVSPAPDWAAALDAVLGEALRAVPVDALDGWRESAGVEAARGLWLVERGADREGRSELANAGLRASSLLQDGGGILAGDCAAALLGGLRPIDTLDEALARRHELGPGEAWLTPQGELVSRHGWRRPPASEAGAGTLARRLRLAEVEAAHADLRPRMEEAQAVVLQARQAVQGLEARLASAQRDAREILRRQGEAATRVEQLRLRLEQAQGRLRGQRREQDEVATELARVEAELEGRREAVRTLTDALREQEAALAAARSARDAAEQAIALAREAARAAERDEQAARARLQTLERECELRTHQLEQHRGQAGRLAARRAGLEQRAQEAEAPLAALAAGLEMARASEAGAAEALNGARQELARAQEATRQAQEAQMVAERALEGARRTVEGRRLTVQALALRAEAPAAALAEAGKEAVAGALEALPGVDVEGCQARLEETRARIARLGAVNLAALDEYEEARQRKAHLDAQQADLTEALATLEAAIAKMDRETRGRFRATFEAVNAKLGEIFQRLFGGGEAYLSLTSDDWLEAGVALMARPPGKKVSHIHLLSGGEKSLTAIALVFAIFQLNPAPFCLLDEVDAPLDEANVGRFCAMVREMAERVQFIFITHNKTTMELARQLVGVTMREAGVSRIVAVDLDEAVRLVETRALP